MHKNQSINVEITEPISIGEEPLPSSQLSSDGFEMEAEFTETEIESDTDTEEPSYKGKKRLISLLLCKMAKIILCAFKLP